MSSSWKSDCCDELRKFRFTKHERKLIFGDDKKHCDDKKNDSECDLRVDFRELWGIHAIYTKFFIISVLASIPDADLLAARLLRNQDEIGDFVGRFVGEGRGNRLAQLLREHILAAAGAITAVKGGNQQEIDAAVQKVFENSREVSAFISSLNPKKLPFRVVLDHFNEHNQFVIDMTVARKNNDFAKDIELFDLYYAQILRFSDLILNGIISCH